MHVLLFDIDGTLVLSGNAGRSALEVAFDCVHSIKNAGKDIPFDGKTDPAIYNEICDIHGITPSAKSRDEFLKRYLLALKRMAPIAPSAREMPGVRALIAAARREGMLTGLLTGNISEGARVKLSRFGLWESFGFGAFGEDAETRPQIAEIAMDRGRDTAGIPDLPPDKFVVIGDTPRDVECGKAWGMRTLGVATGLHYSAEDLKAAGADLVLADLTDTDAIIEWIKRV
jgi:phosphoglycolate phosphatase-like HAD superfamily hydrolase